MKNIRNMTIAVSAAAVALTGLTGVTALAESAEYTKHTIAVSAPLTGNNAQYGIDMQDMAELAVAQFNEAGGFGDGEEIQLVVYDDKGDAAEGINVANLIAENEDVFAVVASFGSTVSMAQAPVFQDAGIPMVSPNTSHIDYPGMGDLMIPLNPTSYNSYDVIAEYFYNHVGQKLAILYQNTEQGLTASEVLKDNYEAFGGEVTAYETYIPGENNDFTALLAKLRESGAEAVFINGDYTDVSKAVLQWRDMEGTDDIALCISGNCLIQTFYDIVGFDKLEGAIFASTSRVYTEDGIENGVYDQYTLDWINAVQEQYPEDGCDNYTGAPYDGVVLALDAAKKVGTTDPLAIAEKIREVDHEIVSAESLEYNLDEDGVYQLKKAVSTYVVHDGKLVDASAAE